MILFQFLRPGLKTTAGTKPQLVQNHSWYAEDHPKIYRKDKFAICFLQFVKPRLWWEFDHLFEKI